jgi:DNA modification methylase
MFKVINDDSIEYMKSLDKKSIDMICTDPPYGISFNDGNDLVSNLDAVFSDRDREVTKRSIKNDEKHDYEPLMRGFFEQAARVLKPGAIAAVCCAGGGGHDKDWITPDHRIFTSEKAAVEAGYKPEELRLRVGPLFSHVAQWMTEYLQFINAVVWDKRGLGLGLRYRRNYEFVMIGQKPGTMKWYDDSKRVANVLSPNHATTMGLNEFMRIIPRKDQHPTEKPIELLEFFIKLHSEEGETILDPFCGYGSTGMACMRLNRNFIGIDLNPECTEIAEKRIKAVHSGMSHRSDPAQMSLFGGE